MKIRVLSCISALCVLGMFSSCKSDNDPVPGGSLPAKTYTSADGLEITVDGETAYGQAVTYTPGVDATATITITGEGLDLSSIIGGATTTKATPAPGLLVPTASIIPGSVKVDIPVTLEGDENNATFAGSYATDYCTFSYSGKVSAEGLTFDVADVKLKNTSLAGTYDLKPNDGVYYNIFRMEWYSDEKVQVELAPGFAFPMEMKGMLAIMLGGYELVPVNGEKMKVFDALNAVLKSVTLGEDGSVTAVYCDTAVDGLPEKTSVKGLAQYVVTSDHEIRLILNPYAIMAATPASKADEGGEEELDPSVLLEKLLPIAENLLPRLMPLMSEGIPVCYGPALVPDPEDDSKMAASTDPNFVSFYLDTDFVLPYLKEVAPLLNDDEVVDFIIKAASQDPEMGSMAGMLPPILKSMPAVINTTTQLELGLNLERR